MSLAKLENWLITAHGLHKGALLLGVLQRLTQPPQPAYLELGLRVQKNGFSTGKLPSGGQVALDLLAGSLLYRQADGRQVQFPLNDHSQADVFQQLFGTLSTGELAAVIPSSPGMDLFGCVSQAITSRGGRYRPPKRELFLDESRIQIDPRTSEQYLQVVQMVFTGLARFLAQHGGLKTPLVTWPEHFDISSLLFIGSEIDESQPHLNFGFAPFSEGIDTPYLYAYAFPYPESYQTPVLPDGTYWHTKGWTGAVLTYDAIAARPDPIGFIEASSEAIFISLRALLPG